jgi:excisionase family DNA binding protein
MQFESLVGAPEVARLLNLHAKTVSRMAKEGRLPSVRIGKAYKFRVSILNQWLDGQMTAAIESIRQPDLASAQREIAA